MATNTDQIVTQLVADTKKFDGAMNGSIEVIKRFNKAGEEIGSRVKVVTKHLEEASSKTNSFRDSMTRLSRDIKVTNTIFDALAGSITKAYAAASEGSKIMAAEQFFKNAGKSIEEYRKATNGMVSDAELMKKANLADSMGIDEKTFKQLVMVAEASALKTGQSFDYMFNSIIVGTARSSRLLLDNLGIIVSVGQANDTYAAKIGKTVEALSAEEKQMAFVEEVARKSQGTLDEYANTTDRTAESFARFDASMQNTIDTLKVGLAKVMGEFLPSLTSFFDDVKTLLQSQDWGSLGEYLGLRLVEGLAGALKVGGSSIWRKWMDETIANVRKEADALVLKSEFAAMDKKTEQEDQLTSLLKSFRKATGDDLFYDREKILADVSAMSKETLDAMRKSGEGALAGLIEAIKETASALGVLPRAVQTATGTTGGGGRGKKGPKFTPDPFGPSREEQAMYGTGFKGKSLLEAITSDTQKRLSKQAEEAAKAESARRKKLLDETLKAIEREAEQRKALFEEEKKRQEELARLEQEKYDALLGILSDTAGSVASGTGMFGPVLSGVAPMVGAAIGGPVGAIVGGLLPALGAVVDRLSPVVDFLSAVVKGIELLVSNALSQLLEILIPLGPALTALLGAVGHVIGVILAPIAAILKVVATGVGGLIGIISAVVAAFASILQLMTGVGQILFFIAAGHQVGFAFEMLGQHLEDAANGVDDFIFALLEGVAAFNNGIVKWIRSSIPGMEDFGRLMFAAQFGLGGGDESSPIDENTSALDNNTQALRDFTREFRNLPQSYKAAGTIYATQNADTQWRGGFRRPQGIGERSVDGFANGRWRT